MGTRGFIGFVADEREVIAYNHWDSYPSELGLAMLGFLREAAKNPAVLRTAVQQLRVVEEGEKPAAADIEHLAPWTDLRVSEGSTADWYCLLRGTQGDPAAMLEAGIIEHNSTAWPLHSLFCEWGYLADLDGDGLLEVYRGFQTEPHDQGRFAGRTEYLAQQQAQQAERDAKGHGYNPGLYYPVALMARWPLADLPDDAAFLAALEEKEEG